MNLRYCRVLKLEESRRCDEAVKGCVEFAEDQSVKDLQLLLDGISTMTLHPDILPHASCLLQLQHAFAVDIGTWCLLNSLLHLRVEALQLDECRELVPLSDHLLKHRVLL